MKNVMSKLTTDLCCSLADGCNLFSNRFSYVQICLHTVFPLAPRRDIGNRLRRITVKAVSQTAQRHSRESLLPRSGSVSCSNRAGTAKGVLPSALVVQAETKETGEEWSLRLTKRRTDENHRGREYCFLCSVFRHSSARHRFLGGPKKSETAIVRLFFAAFFDTGSGEAGYSAGAVALAGTDHVCRVCVWGSVFRFGRSTSGHMAGFYHLTLNIMGKSQKPTAQEAVILDVFNEVVRDAEVRKNFIGTAAFDPEKGLILDLNLQIQRSKDNPSSKARIVQSVINRGEGKKPLWEYVGTAYENKSNPDNLTLFLNLRSKVNKDA